MAWETNARHIAGGDWRPARMLVRESCACRSSCITGYGCEDMFFSAGVQQTRLEMLAGIACPIPRAWSLASGCPCSTKAALYNAAAVACDGQLLGLVAKQHLAGDGIHYEPRWFRRWPAGVVGSDRSRRAANIRSATCCSIAAACGSASKSAATRGWPIAPGARLAAARGRRAAQPQRQPFRVRQATDSRAVRAGRLAGVLRELCVCQPAGQRSGPGDLRRRHADRQRRQDARPRAAVFVCRLAADDGRRSTWTARAGCGRQLSRCELERSDQRRRLDRR